MKNVKLNKIVKNTLKNGGGSFKVVGNKKADKGYMCSIKDIAIVELEDFNSYVLSQIIKDNKKLLNLKNNFLGTWIEDNKVFIDISKNYKNKKYCLKIARQLNQLAIFDLNNLTSIYLK